MEPVVGFEPTIDGLQNRCELFFNFYSKLNINQCFQWLKACLPFEWFDTSRRYCGMLCVGKCRQV